jgi:NAD(P)-dependent dehydrogenase (short-subunit alcohol dehydrogenase family)
MDLELTGRTALVTGSSAGVGRAAAARLAAEGCSVLIHGRHQESADEAAADIQEDGGSATVVLGDLTDPEQAAQVASLAREHRVDILVNNVGPFFEHDWDSAKPADWDAAFQANVMPAVRLTQALTPGMRERGWGRVINIGSRATITPLSNMVEYSAAKAAVVNLTATLAKHLAPCGVTVNCVSPGVILTPSLQRMFTDRRGGSDVDWANIEPEVTADYAPNPVGRLGRPEDIADAIAFLASPRAGYINGANIPVDGGITGTI